MMTWNELIIKGSHGAVTSENIDDFNCDFFEQLNWNHDSDDPEGTEYTFDITVWGLHLSGYYTAELVGDPDNPKETEPSNIELTKVDDTVILN